MVSRKGKYSSIKRIGLFWGPFINQHNVFWSTYIFNTLLTSHALDSTTYIIFSPTNIYSSSLLIYFSPLWIYVLLSTTNMLFSTNNILLSTISMLPYFISSTFCRFFFCFPKIIVIFLELCCIKCDVKSQKNTI